MVRSEADTRGSPTDTPLSSARAASGIGKTGWGSSPKSMPEYQRFVGGARPGSTRMGPVSPLVFGSCAARGVQLGGACRATGVQLEPPARWKGSKLSWLVPGLDEPPRGSRKPTPMAAAAAMATRLSVVRFLMCHLPG